ncbi:MAG TPA: Rieske 2Fe-2S domain-containing protein [Acidimicrobiales bacterium]
MRATSIGHAGILIQTKQGTTIVCDPWFEPAFFGSWFVFPRNDRLPADVRAAIERPDYLYISHLHGDHFDEAFLRRHIDRGTTVLLPGFPTHELERRYRAIGFETFIQTRDGVPVELGDGLQVTIHVETSITDGPGGDSAIMVWDGETRLLNMNDCRLNDLPKLTADGPIDQQWLQFSGAIWYPMAYEYEPEDMRRLVDAKVDAQFKRAIGYVAAVGARAVVPSAGPPCFLDPDLFQFNIITGDELSIFPDATEFVTRLQQRGIDTARIVAPGGTITTTPADVEVSNPPGWERAYDDKLAYLREYQSDWAGWLDDMKAALPKPTTDLLERLQTWWEPLLAKAPTLAAAVGAPALIRSGDLKILVDFPSGQVRAYGGERYDFRFDIPRPLLEQVVAERAVDWSNSLFLSCRFRAWRRGEFNEFLYNFLKSLSEERIVRAEAEAHLKIDPPTTDEEIERGGYVFERFCPHRKADLTVFGEIEEGVLTCTLHGWQFDCETGRCLTAADRSLRVRRV